MKSNLVPIFTVLAVLAMASVGRAGPMFSLSTTEPDLSNLTVGQTVTFQVNLSGLAAGDQLDYLAAKSE